MKKTTKFMSALVSAAATIALIAGCSGDTAAPEPSPSGGGEETAGEALKVGFLVKSLAVDFWKQVVVGAEEAAAELGDIEVVAYAPDSESNVDQQINQVESLIAQEIDAIVVASVAPVQMLPVLEKAADAGIPVVVLDTRVEGFEDKQVAYVGTDNRNGGKVAGEFIIESLGGLGSIGLVNGTPGVPAVEDRLAGVRDAVEGTDVEIVGETAAVDCTTDMGVKAAEDLLSANPGLDAMFVACGNAAVGAQQAVKSAGIAWEDFVLVGFDAAPEELTSIQAGEQRATIAQDQHAMGADSLTAAIQALRGETIENPNVDPGVQVVSIDNVADFIN